MKLLKGTSIIEIVIATALISVGIIAALSLVNNSQKQNTYARGLAEASRYASQASDWIRSERTTLGWATLNTINDGVYCLNNFPVNFLSLVAGPCDASSFISNTIPAGFYQRKITLSKNPPVSPTSINIVIEVSWMEKILRQATIEMELTQW